ncbi:MAG: thermostable hemolysin [Geminicoccaceae bacterium]
MPTQFITEGHPLWWAAMAHIKSVYRQAHQADIVDFAPEIVVATNAGGCIICAAGLRTADNGFFSEAYLDAPIAETLSFISDDVVRPSEVIEVVTLASSRTCAALPLLDAITSEGRRRGMRFGFFTATNRLRSMLQRAGLPLIPLAPAHDGRIANANMWGHYYRTDPWVCALPDSMKLPLAFCPRLARKLDMSATREAG